MMNAFKLEEISLIEMDSSSNLREREYLVYSFFEADRVIEQINRSVKKGESRQITFHVRYLEGKKKRHYKGVFRFDNQKGVLSLQRHIVDFLNLCEKRLSVLRMTEHDFQLLKQRMQALFEACSLEEMFKLNRHDIFVDP